MSKRSADAALVDAKRVQVVEPDASTRKWSLWLQYMRQSRTPLFFFQMLPADVVDVIGALCGPMAVGVECKRLELARCLCQSPKRDVRKKGWKYLCYAFRDAEDMCVHLIVSTNLMEILRGDTDDCERSDRLWFVLSGCFTHGAQYMPQFIAANLHLNFLRICASGSGSASDGLAAANIVLRGDCMDDVARFFTVAALGRMRSPFSRPWAFVALRVIVFEKRVAKYLPSTLRDGIKHSLTAESLFDPPVLDAVYRNSVVADAAQCGLFGFIDFRHVEEIARRFTSTPSDALSDTGSMNAIIALCKVHGAADVFATSRLFMHQLARTERPDAECLLRLVIENSRRVNDCMQEWICHAAVLLVRRGHANFVWNHLLRHPHAISLIPVSELCSAVAEIAPESARDFQMLIAAHHMDELLKLPLEQMLAYRGFMSHGSMPLLARFVRDADNSRMNRADIDSWPPEPW